MLHCGHRVVKGKSRQAQKHPVSHVQWMALLRAQFRRTLDEGVVVLGQEGACGGIFQITLLQYGYTFIAKGVTGRAVPKLLHEEAVYEKLQPLQGRHVPVCLGSVDLRLLDQIYFYDVDVRMIYFLLLSYGGAPLQNCGDQETQSCTIRAVSDVLDQMHRLGVIHGDVRLPNVLQGPAGKIMLVDFDGATLIPAAAATALGNSSETLSAISPNRRRRLMDHEGAETDTAPPKTVLDAELRAEMDRDKTRAHYLFTLDNGRPIWITQ